MINNSFYEQHEYYVSILRIRLGRDIYNNLYEKIVESEYYLNVAIKFRSFSKFPDFLQILMLTNSNPKHKNRINKNADLLEALIILNFLHTKINLNFSVCSEENLILLQKNLFNYYENNIYKTF